MSENRPDLILRPKKGARAPKHNGRRIVANVYVTAVRSGGVEIRIWQASIRGRKELRHAA